MSFAVNDWRAKRNMLNKTIPTGPMRYSISNYSTDASIDKKLSDMKTLDQEIIYNSFHSLSDPLIQSLANSVITIDEMNKKNSKMSATNREIYLNSGMEKESLNMVSDREAHPGPSLAGIAGFFSNVIGAISGALFQRRPKSPVSQYYDCFDGADDTPLATSWLGANNHDQNKNGWAHEQCGANDNMNNCKTAAAHCEGKINAVKSLLAAKTVPAAPRFRPRRPKKLFVEAGAVEDCFEDAITPDDFVSVPNDDYIEYVTVCHNHNKSLDEIATPQTKTDTAPALNPMEITNKTPETVNHKPEISENPPAPMSNVEDITNLIKNVENSVPEIDLAVKPLANDVHNVIIENNLDNNTKQNMPEVLDKTVVPQANLTESGDQQDLKETIILSCEEKLAKLKSLLQNKQKPTKSSEINSAALMEPSKIETTTKKPKMVAEKKNKDKHFKNPHRSTEKRVKTNLLKNIQNDTLFAHEIDSEELSSNCSSPVCGAAATKLSQSPLDSRFSDSKSDVSVESSDEKEYFDEVKGRFHKISTTDSEDSFQIVFSDSPKHTRTRKPSDCESEDSFIVFEDTPDSCYTTNEVFGDTEESDVESESEMSDSGCVEVCKLSHSFSKTFEDLTSNSLYEDDHKKSESDHDELDCAVRTVCEEIPSDSITEVSDGDKCTEELPAKTGVLIDAEKKLKRKNQPPKKVSFSEKPPKVHVMRVWAFAARQARAGHWERNALDRERFKRRIADVDVAISWVLKPQHRSRVMFQRFMPWWHALRRKEIAEKKQKQEEERLKKLQEEEAEKERLKRIEEGIVEDSVANITEDTLNIDSDLNNAKDISNIDSNQSVSELKTISHTDDKNNVATEENVVIDKTRTGNKETKENVNGKIGGLKGKKEHFELVKSFIHKNNPQIGNKGLELEPNKVAN